MADGGAARPVEMESFRRRRPQWPRGAAFFFQNPRELRMDRQPSPQTVVLTAEFDRVFTRMLEIAGFENTSKPQRVRLLCSLRTLYPDFVDDLLKRRREFIGPIVLS